LILRDAQHLGASIKHIGVENTWILAMPQYGSCHHFHLLKWRIQEADVRAFTRVVLKCAMDRSDAAVIRCLEPTLLYDSDIYWQWSLIWCLWFRYTVAVSYCVGTMEATLQSRSWREDDLEVSRRRQDWLHADLYRLWGREYNDTFSSEDTLPLQGEFDLFFWIARVAFKMVGWRPQT